MNDEINAEIIDAMGKVMRTMKHSMDFKSRGSHVTMLQYEALWCIKKSKHAQMRDIANHFETTMPTATSLIDKLIATKLTKRENDRKDRRIVRISLTREGERLLRNMARQRESKIHNLLSYLSIGDKKELLRILEKMVGESEKYEK